MDSTVKKSGFGYPTPVSLSPKRGSRLMSGSRIVDYIPQSPLTTILETTEPCIVNYMGINFVSGTISVNLGVIDRLKITGNGNVLCDGSYTLSSGGLDIIGSTAGHYYATHYGGSVLVLPVSFETLKVEIDTTSVTGNIGLYGSLVMI